MELIIGTGAAAHVTSVQHRDIFSFIIGRGSYIPAIYEQLQPELQTNNSIKIRSGYLVHHGGIAYVQPNTYDQVTIQNGTQGMQRYDLIVARYTLNPETEVETMSWVVIQGTPAASNPVVPDYTHGNMQDGDLVDDCPVVRIKLDGIQVTEVVPLLTTLNADLSTLNSYFFETSYPVASLPAGTTEVMGDQIAITASGIYLFYVGTYIGSTVTGGGFQVSVRVNGSTTNTAAYSPFTGTNISRAYGVVMLLLNAGDYVQHRVSHNISSAVSVQERRLKMLRLR